VSDPDRALAETELGPVIERTATLAVTTPEHRPVGTPQRTLGRYRLERELGAGGMGIVHAAFDPELERRGAIKLILRATSADARARLLREARAMARLAHPNIVTIYEIGSESGRDFVTMELIDGGSLSDWLRAAPRSTAEILDAFIAAGRGLAAAHEAGIVHRDFKPHNVLRSSGGRIVVGDFGLATGLDTQVALADIRVEAYTTLTATGSWVGTPAYMAPEQWNGGTITPATDQFAFCVALWEALAGERPYREAELEDLRAAVTRGPAKLDASGIPRRLRGVLRRGLDPDPANRWPDMPALLAALRPDRRKLYTGVSAVAGLALSASVLALAVTRGEGEPAARPPRPPVDTRLEPSGLDEARIVRQATIEAKRGLEHARRDLELAFRDEGLRPDGRPLLEQVSRVSSGRVTAPPAAVAALVDELRSQSRVRLVPNLRDGRRVGFATYAMRPGSFVDAIGLSNGDVITAIDGRPLVDDEALATALEEIDPDEPLELEVTRGKDAIKIVVVPKPGPELPPSPPEPPEPEVHVLE